MDEALFSALLLYIEARIEARMVQHSSGPHVAAIREASRRAERELYAAAKVKR